LEEKSIMTSSNKNRPNIVFALVDDLGIWALSSYGNHEIRTPHLDRLAQEGIRFDNFFCTSPVCSPARASLLTGQMPSQHGVQDWIRVGNGIKDEPLEYMKGRRCYSEILAESGYVCGISGKWHLGSSFTPQKGFSHWFVHLDGAGKYNDVPMIRDGAIVETKGYISDVIVDDAVGFMKRQQGHDQPFYLSVNFTAPHSPWVDQHPQHLVDSYADCKFETCPQETRHSWLTHHPIEMSYTESLAASDRKKVTVRDQLQGYFAAVTAMDQCIGRLREQIAEMGIEENTLFIFMSDNGFNCGHHGIWGKGNATFPLNMYDSSVKVPFMMAHPGTILPGQVSDCMLSGYDFMPTLLDYVGLSSEGSPDLPGSSFRPLLLGTSELQERSVVVYDEYGPTRMIRDRHWKYVHRYPYGPHELYDVRNDPGERVNLLADERVWDADEPDRKRVAEYMREQMEVWFEQFTDPRLDARVQPVTGRGQLGFVGPEGRYKLAFNERETRKTD
jgi:arylsulfatase A-like enzyme